MDQTHQQNEALVEDNKLSTQRDSSVRQTSLQIDSDAEHLTKTRTVPLSKLAHGQGPVRKRLSRRMTVLCFCMGLCVLAASLSGLLLYQNYNALYHQGMAQAKDGMQHLQTAEKLLKQVAQGSFDTKKVTQARREFAIALNDFSQLKNNLASVPEVATGVPKYGSLLSAAMHLVPLAIELSQAGIIGCDGFTLLTSHLHTPLDTHGQGITKNDFTIIQHDVLQIKAILNTATDQINHLQPSDIQSDSRIGPALSTFRTALPEIQKTFQTAEVLLNILPVLLGISQPASYLIEQLDSTELRPGGGFIGNYGIATFNNGRIANLHITDTYLLDKPFEYAGHSIPYPPAYSWFSQSLAPNSWSLRDSNLDADFPTAARYAEQIYQTEGGKTPLQGVIAITPAFIEHILNITGPIYVDEYHETITASNLIDRIHYHQLKEEWNGGDVPSADGFSSIRKHFTALLFEHFFERVRQVAPASMPQLVSLLRDALSTKDIQFYLNDKTGEDVLQKYQLASAIQTSTGDGLLIIDANITGSKSNKFITYNLHDQVTINTSGSALHHTTLTYNWPINKEDQQNNYGASTDLYNDYVRIYAPPASTLQSQSGWMPQSTSVTFGHKVWAGILTLSYGKVGTISLNWTAYGAATKDAKGWHYHDLLQKQAGITWHLGLGVTLPHCAHITNKPENLVLSGPQSGTLNQDLTTDLYVGADYSC